MENRTLAQPGATEAALDRPLPDHVARLELALRATDLGIWDWDLQRGEMT